MGTRGIFGVVIDGVVKDSYNHYDSYPSGLGLDILKFARELTEGDRFEWFAERARKVQLVRQTEKPSPEVFAELNALGLADPGVSTGDDWYAALRLGQGNLGMLLDGGYLPDAGGFHNDSLFCEWGYLVNFDDRTLEAYQGFQTVAGKVRGRFHGTVHKPRDWKPAYEGDQFWYPISLLRAFPLDQLPADDEFVRTLEPERQEA